MTDGGNCMSKTMAEASDEFFAEVRKEDGPVNCPCCRQPGQVYLRTFTRGMIPMFMAIYNASGKEMAWVNWRTITTVRFDGDYSKLKF